VSGRLYTEAPGSKDPAVSRRFDSKPPWLKVLAPGGEAYTRLKGTLRRLELHTVCEEAHCPNVGECWREGTATVMVLGDVCTRGCRFCAVTSGNPRGALDRAEPENVARAVAELGLRYVVLTMVDRDDLADGGASHVAETVRRLRALSPELLVEALVGDFRGVERDIDTVLDAEPDVFAHNLEVVRRVTRIVRDARCSYDRSLGVLRHAKARAPERRTKSSLMVGAGETDAEVIEALRDLRGAGVDLVTIGQYLRPSPKHLPVDRYVEPERFEAWGRDARAMGFSFVASGPLVRSSYRAGEVYVRATLSSQDTRAGSGSWPSGRSEPSGTSAGTG
jgi:lipoic acid synthetase